MASAASLGSSSSLRKNEPSGYLDYQQVGSIGFSILLLAAWTERDRQLRAAIHGRRWRIHWYPIRLRSKEQRSLPVTSPNPRFDCLLILHCLLLLTCVLFAACNKATKGVETDPPRTITEKKPAPAAIPMWLGNPERTFYGTG